MQIFTDLLVGLLPLLIIVVVIILAIYSFRRWGSAGLVGAIFFWPLLLYLLMKDRRT